MGCVSVERVLMLGLIHLEQSISVVQLAVPYQKEKKRYFWFILMCRYQHEPHCIRLNFNSAYAAKKAKRLC